MADEQNQEQAPKKKSSLLGTLIPLVVIVLCAAIAAVGLFMFVIKPRLGDETKDPVETVETIPPEVTPLELESMQAAVQSSDPDMPGLVLVYQVVVYCADPLTSQFIQDKMAFFRPIVDRLHRNRTKSEVTDADIQDEILRQITMKFNDKLKELGAEEGQEVLESEYLKFTPIPT